MAFSIRSFFGKEKGSDPMAPGSPSYPGSALPPLGANPFQQAPSNPFAASAAHQAADQTSAPMNSPFTPFTPANSGRTELTVGDILPGLPPEAVNNRQLPLNQPLHLADEVVERALSSGQAALPLFEIYRVCPALFPAPISPEDRRTVAIPPHKIAALIPKTPPPAASGAPASPFAIAPAGSVPGYAGGPSSTSLFSPFVQVDPPGEESSDSTTTLFHPSPFNFGAPMSEAAKPAPDPAPAQPASPFGLAGSGPEAAPGAPAPGVPNPFAPTSAASFSNMAFGTPPPGNSGGATNPAPAGALPFSFGTPGGPPSAPPQPESAPAAAASPFASVSPHPSKAVPVPFDFACPAKAPPPGAAADFSPFAPAAAAAPSPGANPLWSGGSPFAPNQGASAPQPPPFAPEPGPFSQVAASVASSNTPYSAPPAEPAPSAPPHSLPLASGPTAEVAPNWMPTPAKPAMGASPFAGFAVPPAAPPAPLAPLPPDHFSGLAPESEAPPSFPSSMTAPPGKEPVNPVAGMPAFPGFSPAPGEAPMSTQQKPATTAFQPGPASGAGVGAQAESALPPLQPGPFSPAPELPRPVQPSTGMNPFERIQALNRTETGPVPAASAASGPSAESAGPFTPSSAGPGPASPSPFAFAFAASAANGQGAAPAPAQPLAPEPPAASAPAAASVFAPAPELHPMPPQPVPQTQKPVEKVTLGLGSILRNCKTHEIGMSPDHIPSWVRVNLPLDLIRPQLPTGKVTLRVTQVMASLEPELRNLITPSRPDLTVDLPMHDLRRALPNELFPAPAPAAPAPAPASEAAAPSSSTPAFAFQVFSPAAVTAGNNKAPDLVFGTPTTPPPGAPFFQAPSAPAEAVSAPTTTDSAWPLPPGSPEPEPAPAVESPELETAFSFLKEEPEVAAAAPAEEVVVSMTPPAAEVPTAPSMAAPVPVTMPARPAAPLTFEPTGITKSAIRVIPPTPASQSASQMLLRALLNTDEPLDTPTVVQLMACQPGIVAVVCLRDGTCLASAGNGSAEAEHFINQAPKLHHHVQPLIQLTGSLDTETFSMNSGPLVITFSLQTELTLGVLHDPRTQGPALRERITLIARELTPLLNLPAA